MNATNDQHAEGGIDADFWRLYNRDLEQEVENRCRAHVRRVHATVDSDDMVSWVNQRVWKLLAERPNRIVSETSSAEQAIDEIKHALPLLVRWAYLAHVRKAVRTGKRERAMDAEIVETLATSSALPKAFEQSEAVRIGLDAIRKRVGSDIRAKLAATWPNISERERIAKALQVTQSKHRKIMEEVAEGDIKPNTVHQMRSRSLKRSRDVFDDDQSAPRKFLPVLLAAPLLAVVLAVAAAAPAEASDNDDDGEQTGGRHTAAYHVGPQFDF